uniref:G protein-coupled receptor 3 n=1 Tax=Oryzias latipes TaxID=8090 RepID=H2M5V4_ORYLA
MILNASELGWDESSGMDPVFPLEQLESSSSPKVPPLTVWGVALCVSGTVITAENTIVITTILATPSLRAPVFLLLASLGLADLLAGVALILHFLFQFCVEPRDWSQLLTSGLLVTSLTASLCSLMGVALDRYLSLSHALTYGSGQSRRRAATLLLLVWLGACAIGAGPAMGWHCLEDLDSCSVAPPLTRTYLSLLCGGFLVVVAVTLQLYAGICRVARRHAHAIATQRHFLPTNQPYANRHSTGRGFSRLILVLSVFVGCWMPFSLWGLLGDASSPPLYTYATLVPAAGSSLLNPILYSLRNKDIRKVLLGTCLGCPLPLPTSGRDRLQQPRDPERDKTGLEDV